jgi:hypothetical protein
MQKKWLLSFDLFSEIELIAFHFAPNENSAAVDQDIFRTFLT